ncbi:hypothetical protein M6D93_00040 [Jatrophihabitans telluris]|uniref:Uncharacterized protein n=1 Tax=Jatrophihabitans telluris TaxID=2038343 RepID=A0ABY4QZV6_9ACTN|nr:hypothetical protein [Jatrophihabitans telluris]UQX88411.1 hypothetical protein M6D93_00040 [Jatrophihabitans telluris]
MSARLTFILQDEGELWLVPDFIVGPVPAVGDLVDLRGETWRVVMVDVFARPDEPTHGEHYRITVELR